MEIVNYNATTLAFIGDAWMSMQVRLYMLEKGFQNPNTLQRKCSAWVCAKAQAHMLHVLQEQDFFNEDEEMIIARGRNATIKTKAKNADVMTYRYSTAFEALIGYLYLFHKEERLNLLWEKIEEIGETL